MDLDTILSRCRKCGRGGRLAHVVSSVLHSGLYINTLLIVTLQRNLGRGDVWRSWRGGGWLVPRANTGLLARAWHAVTRGGYAVFPTTPSQRTSHILFYTGMHVMGVFDSDCSLGGGGFASPLTDRSLPAQNARKEHWLGSWTRPHLPRASPPLPRT